MSSYSPPSGGDLLILVFIVFALLKSAGDLDWSWWAVCTPLYALFLSMVVGEVLRELERRRR